MTKSVTIVFALAAGLTVGIAVGGAARSPGGEGLNSRSSIFL